MAVIITYLLLFCTFTTVFSQVQWAPLPTVPTSSLQELLTLNNGTILAIDASKVMASSTGGATWYESSTSYKELVGTKVISAAAAANGFVYCSVQSGINDSTNVLVRSSNNGVNWSLVRFNTQSISSQGGQLESMHCLKNNTLIAVFHFSYNDDFKNGLKRIVVSTDNGSTFRALSSPDSIESISVQNDVVFIFDSKGYVYEFERNSETWKRIFTPLIHQPSGRTLLPAKGMYIDRFGQRYIWATEQNTSVVYRWNGGAMWDSISSVEQVVGLQSLTEHRVLLLHTSPNWLRTPSSSILERDATRWIHKKELGKHDGKITHVTKDSSGVCFCSDEQGLIKYDVQSDSWLRAGLSSLEISHVVIGDSSTMLVWIRNGYLSQSHDGGTTWHSLIDTLTGTNTGFVLQSGLHETSNGLFYTHYGSFVRVSKNSGITWDNVVEVSSSNASMMFFVGDLAYCIYKDSVVEFDLIEQRFTHSLNVPLEYYEYPNNIIKTSKGNYIIPMPYDVLLSTDRGKTFVSTSGNSDSWKHFPVSGVCVSADGAIGIASSKSTMHNEKRIGISKDDGRTWIDAPVSINLPQELLQTDKSGIPYSYDRYNGVARYSPPFTTVSYLGLKDKVVRSLVFDSQQSYIYAITPNMIYKGTEKSKWEATNEIFSANKSGKSLVSTGDDRVWLGYQSTETSFSANNGLSWFSRSLPIGYVINRLFVDTKNILRACTMTGLFHFASSSWHLTDAFPLGVVVYDIASSSGGTLFAGAFGEGVYSSTDGGESWSSISSGIPNVFVRSVACDNNNTLFALSNSGIFRTNTTSVQWENISANLGVSVSGSLIRHAFDEMLYINTNQGFYSTSTSSINWNKELSDLTINDLLKTQSGELFAATSNGIYRKKSKVEDWIPLDFLGNNVLSLTENGTYYFAAIENDKVYRLPKWILSDVHANVAETKNTIRVYPIPTDEWISVSIPEQQRVELCDVLGNILYSTMADVQSVTIDMNAFAAGTYFLRIGKLVQIVVKR